MRVAKAPEAAGDAIQPQPQHDPLRVIAVAPYHVGGTQTEAHENFRIVEIQELRIVGHLESDQAARPTLLGARDLGGEPGRVGAEGLADGALRGSARIQGRAVVRVVEAASTLLVEGDDERDRRSTDKLSGSTASQWVP